MAAYLHLLPLAALLGLLQQEDPAKKLDPLFSPPAEYREETRAYRTMLRFDDGRPVETPAQWQERRGEIRKRWDGFLGAWPPLVDRPAMTEVRRETVEGFTRLRVHFPVARGRETQAYLLLPAGAGPFPAVLDVFYYPEDGAGLRPEKRLQNDFGYQLVKRGFVALCVGVQPGGAAPELYYPDREKVDLQPLSYLAYVAANAWQLLASRPEVDPARVGVVGHSYGGKWALFAGALWEKFAAVAVSDPGIVFDERRSNVNYWEPWYLGWEAGVTRKRGIPDDANPRTGPYRRMMEEGRDLHELHALLAPRPFFVAGGSEDPPERWRALHSLVAVNRLLGFEGRVGMSNRPAHKITPEANEQICLFFERFLGKKGP